MLPEPNFPVKPDHFIGRTQQLEEFRQALQFGLAAGRTSSFAILGDWGIGKSSLLLKFATVCTEPAFAMLPVFIPASKDIQDYLRFAESLLDKFAEALMTAPGIQTRLQLELQNWRFKRVSLGGFDVERESPRLFLSSGSSLLRHALKEAWDQYLRAAHLNGAIFFVDDLHNITSIAKANLALTIRDQFQFFGIENLNYSICFSAKSDYFAETKTLAEPAVRFYTKLYLVPFTREETLEYVRAVFPACADLDSLSAWLHNKTLGHPYFLAFVCRQLSLRDSQGAGFIPEERILGCRKPLYPRPFLPRTRGEREKSSGWRTGIDIVKANKQVKGRTHGCAPTAVLLIWITDYSTYSGVFSTRVIQ